MNISTLFPLIILLLFIPILLSSRKQKRNMAAMQQLQSSLSEGDVVVTTSGLRGTVVDSSYEETVDIEIAPGVVTTWVRAAVRETVNPTEPSSEDDTPADDAPRAVDAPAHEEIRAPATPAPEVTKTDGPAASTTEAPANDSTAGRNSA